MARSYLKNRTPGHCEASFAEAIYRLPLGLRIECPALVPLSRIPLPSGIQKREIPQVGGIQEAELRSPLWGIARDDC